MSRARTRFKLWWRLVGSAIEHAVSVSGGSFDFQKLFLSQEEDEEESASLADALVALDEEWPGLKGQGRNKIPGGRRGAQGERSKRIHASTQNASATSLCGSSCSRAQPPGQIVTAKAVGKRLKRHIGEPVRQGDRTLILKEWRDPKGGPNAALSYYVQTSDPGVE